MLRSVYIYNMDVVREPIEKVYSHVGYSLGGHILIINLIQKSKPLSLGTTAIGKYMSVYLGHGQLIPWMADRPMQ